MTSKMISYRARTHPKQGTPGWHEGNGRRWYINYRLKDLGGKKPIGHPHIERSKGGKGPVIFAERQVWVERGSDELWVVRSIKPHTKKDDYIGLSFYGTTTVRRWIVGATLIRSFRIWEDAVETKKGFVEMLRNAVSERFPKEHRADSEQETFRLLGMDPKTGNRVD